MSDDIDRWERNKGIRFLGRIGIEEGYSVLDFGAGYGHYTIPAAQLVGEEGKVYSVDKNEAPLSAIAEKASSQGLRNIKTIKNSGGVTLKFRPSSLDSVLLFDILHYMERGKRKELYRECGRILRPDKILSVYPKHTVEDHPSGEFEDMSIEDVIEEIEGEEFDLIEKICGELAHDEELVEGCVLNFRKRMKKKG